MNWKRFQHRSSHFLVRHPLFLFWLLTLPIIFVSPSWRISVIWQGKGGVRGQIWKRPRDGRRWRVREEMAHSTELKRNSIVSEQCVPFRWNGCYLDTRETEKLCLHCSPTLMVTNNARLKKFLLPLLLLLNSFSLFFLYFRKFSGDRR